MVDVPDVLNGVASLKAGDVHHVKQQAAAIHVPQEVVPQPRALGGTVNRTGNVGNDKALPAVHPHHARIGRQRGEMVVRDFGACRADAGEQGGLAHAGVADQSDICDQLQLQCQLAFLTLGAVFGKLRRLPGRGCEVLVAPAAAPAPTAGIVRTVIFRHIVYDFAGGGVLDERARRNRQHKVGGVGAVEFLPGSVSAVLCHEAVLETVGKQGVGIPIHAEHDVAAVAAVAAGGTAVRDVLLLWKAMAPLPPSPAFT